MKLYRIPHSRIEYHRGEALVRARTPEEAVDFFDAWQDHQENIVKHPEEVMTTRNFRGFSQVRFDGDAHWQYEVVWFTSDDSIARVRLENGDLMDCPIDKDDLITITFSNGEMIKTRHWYH